MTMNGAVLPILALYVVAAEEQGVQPEQLSGTIQNDILKEFMVRNTYIYPPEPSMRIVADIFDYTAQHMPRFNSISISGYHMQEAGATLDLELAYTLADGVEYVRAASQRARRRRLCAAAELLLRHRHELLHGDRQAAGRAPAVGRAHGAVRAEEPQVARCCARTARPLACRSPSRIRYNNVTRTASRRWPRRLAAPSRCTPMPRRGPRPADRLQRSHRPQHPARSSQQETGVTRTVDPLGGSYYVERLTAELAERARTLIAEVEELGGMTEAIDDGCPKLRIEEAAARTQARIDSGARPIVGVNEYGPTTTRTVDVPRIDNTEVRAAQIAQARAAARGPSRRGRRSRPAAARPPPAARAICSSWRSRPPARARRSARSA